MNRARLQLVPKLPKTTEEVQMFLNSINLKTSKEEPFMLCNDLSENIVLFSCNTNIEFLCQQTTLYMDGTFEFCTKFFGQLFTIHAYFNDVYVPVVFCLLKNKAKCTYSTMLYMLKQKCNSMGYTLNPKTIVIDFETAIHTSTEEVWQGEVQIIGCRFHLAQSWWGKIQQLGLAPEYKNQESPIGTWLKHLFGLTFLPAAEVLKLYS